MNIKSFVIHTNWEDKLSLLSDDELGKITRYVFRYVKTGVIPKMNRNFLMIFNIIKYDIDNNIDSYQKRVEANKMNGKLGGRPKDIKKEENRKNPMGYLETEKTQINRKNLDNDYDYDNNNDIKIIIDNYFNNKKESIKEKVYEHLKIRKKLKAQNTPRAIKLLLKDLDGKDEIEQSIMIDNSIKNSWKCYYPLTNRDKARIREIVPDWLNKEQEENIASLEEIKKLEERIEGKKI